MKAAYTNFTGGEISHSLASRYDLGKFKSSCRHLENFLPDLHGPLHRRMGTRFLEDLEGFSVLIPFEFSADPGQNYVLVLQEGRIRVAQKNGFVRDASGEPVSMPAPYLKEQLYDVAFAQSGDIVYLAHPGHALRKVMRYGQADWRLEKVNFMPAIDPPDLVTVAFSSGDGNFDLRYKVAAVNAKGEVSVAAKGHQPAGKHPSDWVVGDYALVSWFPVDGAESYLVWREDAGIYGLIGVSDGETKTSGGQVVFRDDRYTADQKDTPPNPQDPFTQGNNPGLVTFHQQRLVLGSPALQPQTWHASRTGSYEDFSRARPLKDDDALEFTLASGRIDVIQWMASFGDLLFGTAGGEYKAIGADQGAITPSSLNMREQSYWGSARLRPLVIGNSVLHVQRQGSRVRDLCYSLERDGYAGNDLSVLAAHLFENRLIKQWDYQQSPGSTIYCVRDDGLMLALTYLKEHEIWGWSRVSTRGKFRSVAVTAGSMEDDVYVVAERVIKNETRWYLERFEPRWKESDGIESAFFVDSGLSYSGLATSVLAGLEHLEGLEVAILADGGPLPAQVVRDGRIILPFAARTAQVGLPYKSLVCPQTPEADMQEGASLGRARSYSRSRLRLAASVGGSYGPDLETLYNLPFTPAKYGQAIPPFTGDLEFNPDAGYSPEGKIWFVQDLPLPFTITALMLEVDIAG